jgi:DNA-directed RNA polymerase subunit RPC12/RpoP
MHRRLKYFCSDPHGFYKLYFCEDCHGLRVVRHHYQAPRVESLEKVADAIYSLSPKTRELEAMAPVADHTHESKEPAIPLPEDIVEYCYKKYGMTDSAVRSTLRVLLYFGENYRVAVDGIPHRVKIGVSTRRGYEGIIRLIDDMGDPPFLRTTFSCPRCSKEYVADDMVAHQPHYCPDCLTWFAYDGVEVKETTPTSGYVHVEGFIVNKATGESMPNIPVAVKMRTCETDERGHFRLQYIPIGAYELKISVDGRSLEIPINVDQDFKPLTLAIAKCHGCGRVWIEDEVNREYKCPGCGTSHVYENGKIYVLKRDEAFCYDFSRNWAWYWGLRCPNCNSEVSLDFSNGRWFCNHCSSYAEPKHDYRLFRCILPCGHEHVYSIFYLVKGKSLKCWTCGLEVDLPEHVKSAWKNSTVFDPFAEFAVEGEYFVRKNPWVVPAVLIGGPVVGLALLAFGGKDGGRARDGSREVFEHG